MALTTYPLNNVEYGAEDAELYNCTRGSGVYAKNSFDYTLTGADNIITIGTGLGWIKDGEFSGKVVALKQSLDVDMGISTPVSRTDAIVIQFDLAKNETNIIVKQPSGQRVVPEVVRDGSVYELHLYHVQRKANKRYISPEDITDLRLNPTYCGLMADSVTSVDTGAIESFIKKYSLENVYTKNEVDRLLSELYVEFGANYYTLDVDSANYSFHVITGRFFSAEEIVEGSTIIVYASEGGAPFAKLYVDGFAVGSNDGLEDNQNFSGGNMYNSGGSNESDRLKGFNQEGYYICRYTGQYWDVKRIGDSYTKSEVDSKLSEVGTAPVNYLADPSGYTDGSNAYQLPAGVTVVDVSLGNPVTLFVKAPLNGTAKLYFNDADKGGSALWVASASVNGDPKLTGLMYQHSAMSSALHGSKIDTYLEHEIYNAPDQTAGGRVVLDIANVDGHGDYFTAHVYDAG